MRSSDEVPAAGVVVAGLLVFFFGDGGAGGVFDGDDAAAAPPSRDGGSDLLSASGWRSSLLLCEPELEPLRRVAAPGAHMLFPRPRAGFIALGILGKAQRER